MITGNPRATRAGATCRKTAGHALIGRDQSGPRSGEIRGSAISAGSAGSTGGRRGCPEPRQSGGSVCAPTNAPAVPTHGDQLPNGRHACRAGPALSSSRARALGGLVSPLRIWLVGFGVVGRWLAGALDEQAGRLASRYDCSVTIVGLANARDGFVYDPNGLDLGSVRAAASSGRPITEQRAARVWPSAIDGLRATEADLLVEVTASPPVEASLA